MMEDSQDRLRVVLVRYSQSTRYGPDIHSHHCVEDLHMSLPKSSLVECLSDIRIYIPALVGCYKAETYSELR